MFNTHGLTAVLILALINAKTALTENDYYPGKCLSNVLCVALTLNSTTFGAFFINLISVGFVFCCNVRFFFFAYFWCRGELNASMA